jgi:hypothetical protein
MNLAGSSASRSPPAVASTTSPTTCARDLVRTCEHHAAITDPKEIGVGGPGRLPGPALDPVRAPSDAPHSHARQSCSPALASDLWNFPPTPEPAVRAVQAGVTPRVPRCSSLMLTRCTDDPTNHCIHLHPSSSCGARLLPQLVSADTPLSSQAAATAACQETTNGASTGACCLTTGRDPPRSYWRFWLEHSGLPCRGRYPRPQHG